MEVVAAVVITVLIVLLVLAINELHQWRKLALEYRAFIENPNVKAVDKEVEYKNSYEAKLNALSDERRVQHEAMNEVFDVLNEEAQESGNPQLMQARNVLLRAIQTSTYGR